MAIEKISADLFDEKVIENDTPCLVVISRENCPVCQEVVPRVKELAEEYKEKAAFYYVDVDEDKSILKKFKLKGVPQLLFFKDGEFCGKLAGNVDEDDIEEELNEIV